MRLGRDILLPLAGLGLTVGLLAALWTPPPPPRRRPKPLPPPDEPEPEAWELEAEVIEDVYDLGDDDVVDPEEFPHGSGSPEEHCKGQQGLSALGAGDEEYCIADPLNDPEFAPESRGVPFARVVSSRWPLATKHQRRLSTSYLSKSGWRGSSGRAFAAKREGEDGTRMHAGVDLFGDVGDIVTAPESGQIFRIYPFKAGTWAVYLRTLDNRIINLGEVEKYSWREFKVKPGTYVDIGQPVARIGAQDEGGAHMLHVEVYDVAGIPEDQIEKRIRNRHFRWFAGDPYPSGLTDPTPYLINSAVNTYRAEQTQAAIK